MFGKLERFYLHQQGRPITSKTKVITVLSIMSAVLEKETGFWGIRSECVAVIKEFSEQLIPVNRTAEPLHTLTLVTTQKVCFHLHYKSLVYTLIDLQLPNKHITIILLHFSLY